MKNESIIKDIHKAIHQPEVSTVIIDNKEHPIRISGNGCRYVDYEGVRYMEQNKQKNSIYAVLARNNGYKITWGIKPDNWIRIIQRADSEEITIDE